jgi:hypothetical protein
VKDYPRWHTDPSRTTSGAVRASGNPRHPAALNGAAASGTPSRPVGFTVRIDEVEEPVKLLNDLDAMQVCTDRAWGRVASRTYLSTSSIATATSVRAGHAC